MMIGRICWADLGRFRVEGEKTQVEGLPLYDLRLSPKGKLYPLRLRRGLGLLRGQGVRQLLCPVDFQRYDSLLDAGLRPYDPLPALQGLAPILVLRRLARLGIAPQMAQVALVGDWVSPAFYQLALALSPSVRELSIIAPQGGEALQRQLYRHYGLAPSPYGKSPSLVVAFHKLQEENKDSTLAVYAVDSPDFRGISLKSRTIPPDISPLAWIGLLLETGRIGREDLEFT